MKAALKARAAQLLTIEGARDLTDAERAELVKLSDALFALDAGKLPSVVAVVEGTVTPGRNRPLLSSIEWAKREAAERGWFTTVHGYQTLDGRQGVRVAILAFL